MEALIGEIVQIRSLIDQAVDHDPVAAAEITIPPPAHSDQVLSPHHP
jgi:hypothetical protein